LYIRTYVDAITVLFYAFVTF